jgi:hypothetical protein
MMPLIMQCDPLYGRDLAAAMLLDPDPLIRAEWCRSAVWLMQFSSDEWDALAQRVFSSKAAEPKVALAETLGAIVQAHPSVAAGMLGRLASVNDRDVRVATARATVHFWNAAPDMAAQVVVDLAMEGNTAYDEAIRDSLWSLWNHDAQSAQVVTRQLLRPTKFGTRNDFRHAQLQPLLARVPYRSDAPSFSEKKRTAEARLRHQVWRTLGRRPRSSSVADAVTRFLG